MSLDPLSLMAIAQASRGQEPKVFDWDLAAKLIRETGATIAEAGLTEDWFWTGGTIFDGAPVSGDFGPYLASTWATPVIRLIRQDGFDERECWRMKSATPGWDANTRWPASAIAALNTKE